jgi:hypothetical protein
MAGAKGEARPPSPRPAEGAAPDAAVEQTPFMNGLPSAEPDAPGARRIILDGGAPPDAALDETPPPSAKESPSAGATKDLPPAQRPTPDGSARPDAARVGTPPAQGAPDAASASGDSPAQPFIPGLPPVPAAGPADFPPAPASDAPPPPAAETDNAGDPGAAPFRPTPEMLWTAQQYEEAKKGHKSYGITPQNTLQLAETKPLDSMTEAVRDGVVPNPPEAVWQALRENQALHDAAGSNPRIKAAVAGVGRGAAFLLSAPVGAGLGALVPIFGQTGVSEAILGLAAGGLGVWEYGQIVDALARQSAFIQSFVAAEQLHPGYATAGELMTFGAGLPRALMKGVGRGLGGVADALADQAAGSAARATEAAGVA